MRSKYLIGLLIFVVVLNICVKAQFLNVNTFPTNNRQNVFTTTATNFNNNVVRTQSRRSVQQQNIRQSRQQPFVPQNRQSIQRQRMRPVQESETDTIIIIETEPQRQQHSQQPQRQQQTQQPQRVRPVQEIETDTIIIIETEPQRQQPKPLQKQQQLQRQQHTQQPIQQPHVQQQHTQQPQKQKTQPPISQQQSQSQHQAQQPQRQTTRQPQAQQVQQQIYQQSQTQYPRPMHKDAPIIFPGSTNNPHRSTEQSVALSKPNNQFLAPTTEISQEIAGNNGNGFNVDADGGASNGFGNIFKGNANNNFDNGQLSSTHNGFGNIPTDVGPFDENRWYNPHRPQGNYYRNFYQIFNDIDQKAENDYNPSEEDNEVGDDLNGRSVVSPGQYPHMAALGYRTSTGETEFKCGGSLISEFFVLTAAHCCFLNGEAPHLVKIGDIKLKEFDHDLEPQRRGVAKIHKHPYYNESMYYHDIGLLELTNPIEYTFFVRPIRLWARDEIPYSKVFTMGYGSTSFAQAPTNVLTELDLSLVPLDMCNRTLPSDPNAPYGIVETQICAKDFEQNRDTCQGDSGGPLQLNLERPRRRRLRYYLVGVISYGTFCRSQHPGVYTRVSSYIDWIASIVWPTYFNSFQ